MVNRPPPSGGGSSRHDEADGTVSSSRSARRLSSSSAGPRRGLEWSLRSMHKIDTSAQHFLSNYYGEDDESDSERIDIHDENGENQVLEDQTAYEIFKANDDAARSKPGQSGSIWASLHDPLRTGIVDGKEVVFELKTNVTQKPETRRKDRLRRRHVIVHADKSPREVRFRFYLMHFSLAALSVAFLAAFTLMNVIFAGLFYAAGQDHCCDDPSMSFGDNFAFAIQTSTTIGYGGFTPFGKLQNFLVVMLSYLSTLMNTLFAGLLFTRFVTPVINIQFSDVMTLCNVNGVPCLSFRVGNADGLANPLTDINVRLTYSYEIPYTDHKGAKRFFRQTEELKLLSNRQHGLVEVWTLRHVLDESSPLFGLHFEEHPANKISVFTLSIDAVQDLTKSSVNKQTEYGVEDIVIGHSFRSVQTIDENDSRVVISDYSKISDTEPYPVWYPAKTGDYATRGSRNTQTKVFKP